VLRTTGLAQQNGTPAHRGRARSEVAAARGKEVRLPNALLRAPAATAAALQQQSFKLHTSERAPHDVVLSR